MGFREITSGDKKGKAVAARFIKYKSGTLGLEVAFEFEEPSVGSIERLNWVGWLSSNAMEFTMATLVDVLGFNGNDAVNEKGELSDPKAIDWNREVKLVVELEEYEGKSYPKIKFVNRLGGSQFASCEPQVLRVDLQSVGFKAAFLAAQAKTGAVKKTQEAPF